MPIPKYHEIQLPALKLLADGNEWKPKDLYIILAETFQLSSDELAKMYPSGSRAVFSDRLNWALSYLNIAKVVKKPKIGIYQINQKGLDLLNKNPPNIRKYISEQIKSRDKIIKTVLTDNFIAEINEQDEQTPEELLYSSFQGIKENIQTEILDTILSKTPRVFEEIVVQLLQKMGYGGEIKDAGTVTKYSNDGGIDGVVKEDILGFGKIYIQAKRYAYDNKVPRDDIQKFVGALAVAQSEKGVFITTSDFSKPAIDYAQSLNGATKIVLINGETLANYIYEYNLGMQTEKIIEIKKLDKDFWDNLENNKE
jgi:restriction system protein